MVKGKGKETMDGDGVDNDGIGEDAVLPCGRTLLMIRTPSSPKYAISEQSDIVSRKRI